MFSLVFVWCFTHAINFCATDTFENIPVVKNVVALLKSTSVFLNDSCERMGFYDIIIKEKGFGSRILKKLHQIRNTRWWSISKTSCFGKSIRKVWKWKSRYFYCSSNDISLYSTISKISIVTCEADFLISKCCNFEIFVTAFLLLRVYLILCQSMKYLRTRSLDYLSAWYIVVVTRRKISIIKIEE